MQNILYYILSCAVNGTELEVERLKGVTPGVWQEVYQGESTRGDGGVV
jgi:hypothetical protein